jgi:hypothetical protein
MVGFSLMPIHSMFGTVAMLDSAGAMVWLLPAIPYAIAHRKSISAKNGQ